MPLNGVSASEHDLPTIPDVVRSSRARPRLPLDEIRSRLKQLGVPLGSLRLQLREEDHVADAFLAEEHHAEAVDADDDAVRRGHAVFEGDEEIFVGYHG